MAGANIHGRMLVETMCREGVAPSLVLNEQGTPRAERLADFLRNDVDTPPPLAEFGVPVEEVAQFDGHDVIERLHEVAPDYLIVGGCGIVKEPLLGASKPLNIHPGLLPAYRGLDPVLWSVLNGDPTGATVHVLTAGIDEGPVLLSRPLAWKGANNLLELRLQCIRHGAQLLAEFLRAPEDFPAQPQDETKAQYFSAFPDDRLAEAEERLKCYGPTSTGNGPAVPA